MRRWIAILWHASFLTIAGFLYFYFVLPRYFELTGAWPAGLGNAMRIVCGALIGLAALPVLFTLLRTRKPEFGTPQLALTLRLWSVVLHVLAGALIIGAAVSEFWVSLDRAGAILFGIYGGAAAVALLGALAFYLAFAAELPPPPPKPLKPKRERRGRSRGRDTKDDEAAGDDVEATAASDVTSDTDEPSTSDALDDDEAAENEPAPTPVPAEQSDETADATEATEIAESTAVDDVSEPSDLDESDQDDAASKLKNRRPNGKSASRLFGRSRR